MEDLDFVVDDGRGRLRGEAASRGFFLSTDV